MGRIARVLCSLILVGLVAAACGRDGDNDKKSTGADSGQVVANNNPSPAAGNQVRDQMEEATITISGGKVDKDQITLQAGQATVLHVVNQDGTAYKLEIPELMAPSDVPASKQTDMPFTAPNPVDVEAKLLPAGGGDALDTFRVVAQGPSGNAP